MPNTFDLAQSAYGVSYRMGWSAALGESPTQPGYFLEFGIAVETTSAVYGAFDDPAQPAFTGQDICDLAAALGRELAAKLGADVDVAVSDLTPGTRTETVASP